MMSPFQKTLIFLILVFGYLSFAKRSGAAIYYVSTSGNDSNPGTELRPWRTVQKAANMMVAGDTVNIQAGTYDESVVINRSGTANSAITYSGPGHLQKITTVGANYIIVDGLAVGNPGGSAYSGGQIEIDADSNYITLRNCLIDPQQAAHVEGIVVYGGHDNRVNNCIVQGINLSTAIVVNGFNNAVTNSVVRNTYDADAFRVWGHDNTISYNTVTNNLITANAEQNHSDFIQTFGGQWHPEGSYNIVVEGNSIINTQAQAFYLSALEGDGVVANVSHWIFRNNIWANVSHCGQTRVPYTLFYNNIFYKVGNGQSSASGAIDVGVSSAGNAAGSEIINNMFLENGFTPGDANTGWYVYSGGIDHSLIKASNNYAGGTNYAAKNFSEMYSVNGGAPQFVNLPEYDFHLLPGSPLIDRGQAISTFNYDKDGTPRPQGSAWDIGAYEYVEGRDTTPPAAPTDLTVN